MTFLIKFVIPVVRLLVQLLHEHLDDEGHDLWWHERYAPRLRRMIQLIEIILRETEYLIQEYEGPLDEA